MNTKENTMIPSLADTERAGNLLQQACYGRSYNNGWWHDLTTGELIEPVPFGEKLALCHSELSEALEGYRKGLKDDHLSHRDMVEVELADAVIRICDLAGRMGYNLGTALAEKLDYNDSRSDHKLENRKRDGGKKI